MSKETPQAYIEDDAEEKKPPFEITISEHGNEKVLHITNPGWKETQTFESHFPKDGVPLFDLETKKLKETFSPEEIRGLYEHFLSKNPSYDSLIKMHGLSSIAEFSRMKKNEQELMIQFLNAGHTKDDAKRLACMPEAERAKELGKEK
ncbi:MAG: hypothetical protein COU47_02865 [Candidatus Niyogibacteria bacterium CG10_big_fil_rev_8_21_14_0_10_46_36]|uniref:Uncharacterized protein n=1 Tax=Candidatus Niyogibacteria bacterium CG10_big_fil_rev_8_21_14_0_10_46_36 TaxID=1974726 RepID=A0A2H0TD67_9BACT|nr:MAG: hypothetical protein COU47_02865 [Candidatus Niyogibacteria bacterium CG10_big_fil_rev_8_21_14_0_10_46_36]